MHYDIPVYSTNSTTVCLDCFDLLKGTGFHSHFHYHYRSRAEDISHKGVHPFLLDCQISPTLLQNGELRYRSSSPNSTVLVMEIILKSLSLAIVKITQISMNSVKHGFVASSGTSISPLMGLMLFANMDAGTVRQWELDSEKDEIVYTAVEYSSRMKFK